MTTKAMRSWLLVVTLPLSIVAASLQVSAQRPEISQRVGMLSVAFSADSPMAQTFRQALRDLGYAEGRNILIEWQYTGGRYERLSDFAAELVGHKPDVIVTESTVATLAVKKTGTALPIVMALAADPVGTGLVKSLARPGGNITGLSMMLPELAAKRLELLKELVPQATRVAVLTNPDTPWHRTAVEEIRVAARALRVQPQFVEARGPAQFERAFAAMKRERADALAVLGDPVFLSHHSRIVELAEKHRLPAMFDETAVVHDGGLMAWGVNFGHLFQRAAWYVDRILKGARPGDLPIEQPTRFELVINLKTAKALGLTILDSLLVRADKVIR